MSERLDPEVVTDYPDDVEVKYPGIKNPEVQRLHNYEEIPDESFGIHFRNLICRCKPKHR